MRLNLFIILYLSKIIFYFREAEFRVSVCKKSPSQNLEIFKNYLKLVYDKNKFEFFNEEYLIDFNNYN